MVHFIRSTLTTNHNKGETNMRSFLLAAAALLAFAATMTVQPPTASAAVCADGVWRAGCVGPRGAVVVRKPVAYCRWVWVGGVKVRKCG